MIESPVCTPIGSKFSTVHIITTLSAWSLNNSNSYSFHPKTAFSTNTSCIGEAFNPFSNAASNSLASCTNPPPVPPKVNDGRITNGNPITCANSFPSKKLFATRLGATAIPIFTINCLNCSLSSAKSIAATSTPIMRQLYCFHNPISSASLHKFNAVCPPIVGSTASI